MSSSQDDYYKILQVDSAADPDIIAVAYKRLARKYHPDTNPSPEATHRMQALNTAYRVLRDPITRTQYDRKRAAQASWSARDAEAPRPHEESDAAQRHASEDAAAAHQRQTLTPGMVTRWLVTWLVPAGLVLLLLGPLTVRLVLPLVESPLPLVCVVGVLWLLMRPGLLTKRHPHRPPRG